MTLASTDTADNPVVDINYLDTKTDQEVAIQSYKRAIELVRAAGYVTGPEPEPLTGDDEILDFVRNNSVPFYHATGTCMLSLIFCIFGSSTSAVDLLDADDPNRQDGKER